MNKNIRWKLITIVAVLVIFAGVGVYPNPRSIMVSIPLPARTSSAVAKAGSESACVSFAR